MNKKGQSIALAVANASASPQPSHVVLFEGFFNDHAMSKRFHRRAPAHDWKRVDRVIKLSGRRIVRHTVENGKLMSTFNLPNRTLDAKQTVFFFFWCVWFWIWGKWEDCSESRADRDGKIAQSRAPTEASQTWVVVAATFK